MDRNDIQRYQTMVEKVKKAQQSIDKIQGAIEQLEKQLKKEGFDTIDDFNKWEKKVLSDIEKIKKSLANKLEEAEEIINELS